jgi:membrane-associated protein
MNHSSAGWMRLAMRLFAWMLLLWAIGGLGLASVSAQEHGTVIIEPAPESSSFFMQVIMHLFDSRGLMAVLGQPEYTAAAFLALNLIVFVETGLLVGFCLPGDSLLVTAGLIASNPACNWSVPLLLATLGMSAIAGDTLGYWIGYRTGPAIFKREKSLLFNKDHLLKAHEFYERHGGKTIILARFIPIVRTFAPVVAGVGRMDYRQFLFFNVFGGIGWVTSMVLCGYLLPDAVNPPLRLLFGDQFLVQDHVEKVVILVVLASISPGIFAWLRARLARKPQPAPELVNQ